MRFVSNVPIALRIPPASRYRGMMQIMSLNRDRYVAAIVVIAAAWLGLLLIPANFVARAALWCALGVTAYWMVASLLVSHWIYDRSDLAEWRMLKQTLTRPPDRWASLHAGLDEVSDTLRRQFPHSCDIVLDIYDAAEMTEPSIARARAGPPSHPAAGGLAMRADSHRLPLVDAGCDAVFVIFVAHELRSRASREQLFGELRRTLAHGGRVVLIEHLRDAPNFLAFGPGFLHFFSRSEWLGLSRRAGFAVICERSITPFVRMFVLEKRS